MAPSEAFSEVSTLLAQVVYFERTYDLSSISHAELTISMDFIALDTWDNEKAFISLDGVEVWYWYGAEFWNLNYQRLDPEQQSVLSDRERFSVCGQPSAPDWKQHVSVTVPHAADSAVLRVSTELNSWADDESFGIDNVRIVPCFRPAAPVWSPSPALGVVKSSLPAGREAAALKTSCCVSDVDCPVGHTCHTNVCYAEYALAYDFRHTVMTECTDASYLNECEADSSCSQIMDQMTSCGPLPGTPAALGFPSEGEIECTQRAAQQHWHIGNGHKPVASCTACAEGEDVESCFECCSFIRETTDLGHCCSGSCCELKLANEAEALCTIDAPEWHHQCYYCNAHNDEWIPEEGRVAWMPGRYPLTGGYAPHSIEYCAKCAADLPTRFPHCCRGGACAPIAVDLAEAQCMADMTGLDDMDRLACQTCAEWYETPVEAAEGEVPYHEFCIQCCSLLKLNPWDSMDSCMLGTCMPVPVANEAELQCIETTGETLSPSCEACAAEMTYTGYCVTECGQSRGCGSGQYCQYHTWGAAPAGLCRDHEAHWCEIDSDCDGGGAEQLCNQGMCFNLTWCADESDCASGQRCKPSDNVKTPQCEQCCTDVESLGCGAGGCYEQARVCPADAPFQHHSFDELMRCKLEFQDVSNRAADPCGALKYACWQDEICRTLTHQLNELDPEGLCSPEEVLNGVCWVNHPDMHMSGGLHI